MPTNTDKNKSSVTAKKSQNELKTVLNYVDNIINKPIPKKYIRPYFEKVHSKIGLKPETQCRIILFVSTIYLAIGVFARMFCNFGGFLIPAFKSTRALESEDAKQIRHWLTYWVIYTAFIFVDNAADCVLHFIPFYDLLKAMMLVYAMNNGAGKIYEIAIQPYADNIINIPKNHVELLRRDSDLGLMNLINKQSLEKIYESAKKGVTDSDAEDQEIPFSPRGDNENKKIL